jgi:hypothetical protein
MPALTREPLLHFFLAALALLALDRWTAPMRKPLVEISEEAVDAQVAAVRSRLGRELTADEQAQISQRMLQEEILFREAQKRGMVSDNQVRGTLIAMMRSALTPALEKATEDELRAIRAKLPRENTTLPQQISFDHVSFAKAENIPADMLAKLRNGADPKKQGEPGPMSNPIPPTYRPQIDRLLGGEFSERIFVQPIGEWQGPITSLRGVHFVRVISRQAEQPMEFEAIRTMLESHWMNEQLAEAVTREVDRLKQDYIIILPESEAFEGGVQ